MPLTLPDQSIALGVKTPQALTNIGDMLNMANGALALRKGTATFDADVARSKALSQSAQAGAQVDTANVQPLIGQQQAATEQAQTASAAAKFKLSGDYLDKANQFAQGLVSDPDVQAGDIDKIIPKLNDMQQRMIDYGIPKEMASVQTAHAITAAVSDPKGFAQKLRNSILQSQGAAQQGVAIQPTVMTVDNGQQSQGVNVNPIASGGVGAPVAGTAAQKQLPPGTPMFQANTPGYVGPRAAVPAATQQSRDVDRAQILREELAKAQQQPDGPRKAADIAALTRELQSVPSFVQSGPALGQVENATGTSATVNKDWDTTVSEAAKAAQDIGVLGNIKQYAPLAATGVTGAREALVSGLAGRLGMSGEELKKTSTDLLAKNSNMLALAGGDTNLAKTLAEAANPNTKMTKEAIVHAADQVIAQRQLSINKQSLLAPYKNDPDLYNAVLTKFNKVADPRVLQYPNMNAEELSAMKSAMTPSERKDFGEKINAFKAWGFIK